MYHITVYAALTLFRDAQTWAKGPAATQALANLKHTVTALNNAPAGVAALEIKYNHQVVAEMRTELKMPRPSTEATVSEGTVSGQSVSTRSEADSGQQVVAGSASQASGPPLAVETDDAASERTHAIAKPAAGRGGGKRRRIEEPKTDGRPSPKPKLMSKTRATATEVAEVEAAAVTTLRDGGSTGEVAGTGAMKDADDDEHKAAHEDERA